jgi:hypothetical protein
MATTVHRTPFLLSPFVALQAEVRTREEFESVNSRRFHRFFAFGDRKR